MTSELDELAESHGIQLAFVSELGERKMIDDDAKTALLKAFGVDPKAGAKGAFDEAQDTPTASCAMPASLDGGRVWGVACQLYSLRSARSLGVGDFADLAHLAKIAARAGADFVGVNPLHALFFSEAKRFSPYSPSTRQFLNPFYIAIDELEGGPEAIAALKRAEPDLFADLDGDLVDYAAMGKVKRRLLDAIWAARTGGTHDMQAFERFCSESGKSLEAFALFEALSEYHVAEGGHAGWHHWPEEMRDATSTAVARFAEENAERIRFHKWLQFEAEEQLAEAQAAAKTGGGGDTSNGMTIGLYLDLAVGVAPDGAETWADPSLTVSTARVGSPPDMFNSQGQDWGLAPLSPKALAERDYRPLRDAFGALTRHAGAARIDHAMGLARLWWIPQDEVSAKGGYVRYPLGRMIDAVADASNENTCVVIGEDLGTVPPGFRSRMEDANILSYRVLYFERHGETAYLPPSAYPALSLSCISTHDLATLSGWWEGSDIELRKKAGTQDAEATQRDLEERRRDRRELLIALAEEDLLSPEHRRVASGEAELPAQMDDELAQAIHRFMARTPSVMFAAQLDDMIGAKRQPNLPGTTDQYPNWRIRSPISLDDLEAHDGFAAIARTLREERPRQS